MKSPIQLLTEKRNEMQAEYNRVLKVYPHETGNLKFNESFKLNKADDLKAIKEVISQYNAAIYTLRNPNKD